MSLTTSNGFDSELRKLLKPEASVDAEHTDLLRIATSGSVDDGKSTLIGRMLYDSKAVFADQLEHIEQTSLQRGDRYVNLALLTDGLRAEREQGITIDVAYRYFATPRRKFILADTPGHVRYTRNMVTGASTADVSLMLVDARHGVVEQSHRHAFLASLLGVRHLVVCVNKMDLVGYDRHIFDAIVHEFGTFAAKLEVSDLTFIPISALEGDNVVHRSAHMSWYEGPPLLYHLETVHVASDRNLIDARFPVQWVIRPISGEQPDYRGYAGRVASGILRPNDEVVVLPSGETSRIAALDLDGTELSEAFPPMSVAIRLADDLDISRGDMICRIGNQPTVASMFEAHVCWMHERPLSPGRQLVIKHTTRTVRAKLDTLRYRINVSTLHRDENAAQLELNEIGRVTMTTTAPLMFDPYSANRETGSFILIDPETNDTVGAGMLVRAFDRSAGRGEPADRGQPTTTSPNVVWHRGRVSRDERWAAAGQHGAVVWMTGLPASGKSTLASELEHRLVQEGRCAYVLDGDNLRHGINGDLAFTDRDRAENARRTAHLAAILAESGTVAIVSLVSPHAVDRHAARQIVEERGLDFIEVYVDTPVEECERRDPKGLYRRARAGEISGFTGIDGTYEPPSSPDVSVSAGELGPDSGVCALLDHLRRP